MYFSAKLLTFLKMTRIFGFERQTETLTHLPRGVKSVFDNLQEAVAKTQERGWQSYGMGFIVVNKEGAQGFPVYKGYQGITQVTNISDLVPPELHLALANNPIAFFGVLQNSPDKGVEDFNNEDAGREFPLQSENWLAITMGWWGNYNFDDESLPWFNEDRPAMSIVQYLETDPETINFDWVSPQREAFIVAVRRDGSQIIVLDNYTRKNSKNYVYVSSREEGIVIYQGVRNPEGEQV